MVDRLLALDAPSLYFRAFYGVPETVTAPDGTPVNAVRGFLDFVARLVTDRHPTRLLAAMDGGWRPSWRVAAIPSYKLHRLGADGAEIVPAGIVAQIPVIEQVLDAFGFARVGIPDHEADDVLGSAVARATCPVDVVTGDRDLFQLVDDARGIRVFYTVPKGVGAAVGWDEAAIAEKYAIPGRAYADFATLRGDPSDGLPGVAGIGDKTASQLLSRYGSLAAVLAAAASGDPAMSSGVRAKLGAAAAYLDVAPAVVAVSHDAPLPDYDDALPAAPRDPEALLALSDRWGLASSCERVLAALSLAARG